MLNLSRVKQFICSTFLAFLITAPALCDDMRPIKIGYITDLSASGAFYGKPSALAAEIAVADINSSGKKVEIIIEDGGMQSSRAIAAAQKLVTLDKVDGIVGQFTPMIVPIASTISSSKIPVIYIAAAESPLTKSDTTFKFFHDFRLGCKEVTQAFIKRGLSPIGQLKVITESGQLCSEGVEQATKDAVTIEYAIGAMVDSEVLTLKRKGVKAIINVGYEGDFINSIHAMDKIRYSVPLGGILEGLFTEKVKAESGNSLEGSLAFAPPAISKDLLDKFEAAAKKSNEPFNQPFAMGFSYATVELLFNALSQCQGKDKDCAINALKKSPPMPSVGFERFNDQRMGVFKQRVIDSSGKDVSE